MVKCKVHSVLWQFQLGGGKSENELLFLSALVFPYIFLLFDCFEWALIDCIERCRGHSVLWQFQMGGGGVNWQIYPKSAFLKLTCHFMLCFTEGLFVLHMKDLITVIFFIYMNLSNELSLTTLKSKEITLAYGSFKCSCFTELFFSINRNKRPKIGLYIYEHICLTIGTKDIISHTLHN